jgi:putative inorganic carbon (hco3(-)) transporter
MKHGGASLQTRALPLLIAVTATAAVATLVLQLPVTAALALVAAPLGVGVLIQWPHAATLLATFLLYINFPAILTKQVGLPAPIAGAFILLLAFPLFHLLLMRRERLRGDATLVLMLAFAGVAALASLRAADGSAGVQYIMQFITEGVVLYWLFVNVIRTRVVLQRVVLAALVAGAVTSGLSLYQQVTGSYHQEFGGLAYRNYVPEQDEDADIAVRARSYHRAQGPVDEPNRYAQTLLVLLPLAVVSWRNATTAVARHLSAGTGLLILIGTALTLSRGAFVAMVFIAGAMVLLKWFRPAHLVLALVVAGLLVPVTSPRFVPRMLSIIDARYLAADDPASRTAADGAIRGRTTSMLTALQMYLDHPLLGVGPGQFRQHYRAYSDNPDIKFRAIQGTRRAHNLYLEIAAETGTIGLAVFMAILVGLMRRLWRMRRSANNVQAGDLAAAFVLSLAAYLASGMFLHLAYQRYLWLIVACAGAAVHVLSREARYTCAAARYATRPGRAVPGGAA